MRAAPLPAHQPPQLNDPVVVDGVKYRIRWIDPEGGPWLPVVHLRVHFAPHRETTVLLKALVWDRIAGVWRVQS